LVTLGRRSETAATDDLEAGDLAAVCGPDQARLAALLEQGGPSASQW
jgi:hypothetical protein